MSEVENNKETFEFLRQVTNYLSDRFLQPLSAALLLSWAVWNYKIIMIVISFDSINVKFKNLKVVQYHEVFSIFGYSVESFWWYGFFMPIISAVLFIYAYPYAAIHALEYTIDRQEKVNYLRRRRRESELVDNARARELIKENTQLKIENEKIAFSADQKEKSLTETINILEDRIKKFKDSTSFVESVDGTRTALLKSFKKSNEKIDILITPELENIEKFIQDVLFQKKEGESFLFLELLPDNVWTHYNDQKRSELEVSFNIGVEAGRYNNVRVLKDMPGSINRYTILSFPDSKDSNLVMVYILDIIYKSKSKTVHSSEVKNWKGWNYFFLKNGIEYLKQKQFIEALPLSGSDNYRITKTGELYLAGAR